MHTLKYCGGNVREMRAAEKHGLSLSSFVLSSSLKEATAIVEVPHIRYISNRDRKRLMGMIENPGEPNERLNQALEK